MKDRLFKISLAGFSFTGAIGSLCHFVYNWSGFSRAVALFCPINESIWEHTKLLFLPYLIWTAAEYFLLNKAKGIWFSKAIGLVAGILFLISFYYTYTGAFGENSEILNIMSFFAGVFISFAVDFFMIKSDKFSETPYDTAGIIIFIVFSVLFIVFTFAPPLIPLFKDPVTDSFGI